MKTKFEGITYKKNRFGKKVFTARFKINKKTYKRKVGEEPAINAKVAYELKLKLIREIETGLGSIDKNITELFDEYLEYRRHELSESWYKALDKTYYKHLVDIVGELRPAEVVAEPIQARMDDMLLPLDDVNKVSKRKYAESTVKQLKDCISGLFTWLKNSKKYKGENIGALLVIPKFDNKIYFVMSSQQARDVFKTIIEYPYPHWRAYFLWLLHGRRKMEVAVSTWENLSLEDLQYTIPGENVKNKKPIIAPIMPILRDALLELEGQRVGYIFKNVRGDGHATKSGIDYHWRVIRGLAGVPTMRLHDMRHMIGYFSVNSGYTLEQIGDVLKQDSLVSTKRYANVATNNSNIILTEMFSRFSTPKEV